MSGLKLIENSINPNDKLIYLEKCIRERNSRDAYQSPRNIEYALSLIGINRIWSQLSPQFTLPPDDIKNELSLIIDRRNKISHESDFNPIQGVKYPIDRLLTNKVILFIEKFCENIFILI